MGDTVPQILPECLSNQPTYCQRSVPSNYDWYLIGAVHQNRVQNLNVRHRYSSALCLLVVNAALVQALRDACLLNIHTVTTDTYLTGNDQNRSRSWSPQACVNNDSLANCSTTGHSWSAVLGIGK